jgi:cytochrome c oxidase cbb3-type subunit 3
MYLRYRAKAAAAKCGVSLVLTAALGLGLSACNREARQFDESPRHDTNAPMENRMNALVSGDPAPAYRAEKQHQYEENAYQISEGKRLYSWFNCTGCHAHGGGDIGPPLMDEKWIYGGEIDQIYMTIAEGRPNGMPSFAAKLTSEQIWQVAAYVRTMSGHGPKAARSGRDDHLQMPSEQGRREEGVTPESPANSGAG